MGIFVGRTAELEALQEFFDNPFANGCAVYGIRQIGKTALIRHFAKGKRSVYIQCITGSEEMIVDRALSYLEGYPMETRPRTLIQLFGLFEDVCKEAPTLIILDEYPYLASSVEHADSLLQSFMDGVVKETRSKVIICGSQLSSMMDKVSNQSNPLYGRFRRTLQMGPMSFQDCCLFHEWMDDLDQIRMYMIFGGMPQSHLEMSGQTFEDMMERTFLATGLPYRNIARAVIGSELGDVESNESILRAIASGKDEQKDLPGYTNMTRTTCLRLIRKMESLGILARINPMAGAPKQPRYIIKDGLLGLWYTVFDGLDEFSLPDDIHARYELVREDVSSYMGHRFELFCMEYISHRYICDEIGSWWGMSKDDDGKPVGVDIDLVAKVRQNGKRFVIYAECKFRRRPMKLSDLKTLVDRARKLDDTANIVLFSAGGFERQLRAVAWRYGAVLIGIDELMGRVPAPNLLEPVRPPEYSEDDDDERGR